MNAIAQKSSGSELDITIDWQQSPLAATEAPHSEIGWYVAPQCPGDTALKILTHRLEGWQSRASLAGGAPGANYLVSAAIATTEGRVLMRVILLRIRPV